MVYDFIIIIDFCKFAVYVGIRSYTLSGFVIHYMQGKFSMN